VIACDSLVGVRRRELLGLASLLILPVDAVKAQSKATQHLVAAIPVFPWLQIGQTTLSEMRGPVQAMLSANPRPWYRDGPSEITGGTFMTVSTLAGNGVANEDGLRIFTTVFDTNQRAQLAIFVVEKGWNDANVQPLIKRMTARYSAYASPVRIQDGESDATDYYIFFDIGRFCIEITIPQHGTNATVYFTTKEIHRKLRMADRTYDLFKPYLEQTAR